MSTAAPVPDRDELLRRAARARAMLSRCEMCGLRCGADRTAGARAPCGLGAESRTFRKYVSFAEEVELLPSYMVYLAGCNFRCSFCVQAPDCFNTRGGEPVDPAALAEECRGVVAKGARTINLLGGEPSLHAHTILEVAAAAWPERLPLVLNSNFYMSEEVLGLFDGVIDIALADLKFGNDDCALKVAKVPGYFGLVTANLLRVARTSTLMVRYLLMPGHNHCCLHPIASWIATNLPGCRFNLMRGYVPAWQTASFDRGDLSRVATAAETHEAEAIVAAHGLITAE
ncbi:MAG: radical SAM protein [Phycisphaerales bacterium]